MATYFRWIVLLVLLGLAAGRGEAATGDAGEFVLVAGGCFDMGCAATEPAGCSADERPPHRVCLKDFLLGRTEVTVEAFRVFADSSAYRTDAERLGGCYFWTGLRWEKRAALSWRNPGFRQTPQDPVVCVSWRDVVAYIGWRNDRDRTNLRLPSEAEWEYAARLRATVDRYPWRQGPAGNLANASMRRNFKAWPWPFFRGYEDGFVHTAPVDGLVSNELGVFGLDGNVEEWTADTYRPDAYGRHDSRPDTQGEGALPDRSIRGGSWMASPWFARAVDRKHGRPWTRGGHLGFRLARTPADPDPVGAPR